MLDLQEFCKAMGERVAEVAAAAEPKPPIKVGDRVISAAVPNEDGATWMGPNPDPTYTSYRVGLLSGSLPELKCPIGDVAPYGTALADAKDPRITVLKGKKPAPWLAGNWCLNVPTDTGTYQGWFRTKGDAVAEGRVRLTVLDFHAAYAESKTDVWKPVVDAMSE